MTNSSHLILHHFLLNLQGTVMCLYVNDIICTNYAKLKRRLLRFLTVPSIRSTLRRFVCCDLDGDSRLAPQEMRHFYKVQLHRVTSLVSQSHSYHSTAEHSIAHHLSLLHVLYSFEHSLYHVPEIVLASGPVGPRRDRFSGRALPNGGHDMSCGQPVHHSRRLD